MKETSKLVQELKNLVEEHLRKHPSLSIHGFSKKCGVASSTLRRILGLETKEDPIPSTVLGIVSAVSKENRIQNLIEIYGGEIRTSLMRSYSFVSKFSYRPELSEVLSNREAYIIYKLAANEIGTSRMELIELLGYPVEEKIEELIQMELLYEDQGRVHAKEKNFILPEEISKKHIPELLRFTHHRGRYVSKTIFKNLSESINQKAYEEIWKIQAEANEKICELITKKESLGEVPFFFTCILDTMDIPGHHENHHFGREI